MMRCLDLLLLALALVVLAAATTMVMVLGRSSLDTKLVYESF